ncbi:MAG: S1 RNA-binding domain-containing protein [Caldimicrobium sp.]
MENFTSILEEYFSKQERIPQIGEIVQGKIVHLSKEYAFVDIGVKKEALLPITEITDRKGNLIFQIGEEIRAIVSKKLSGEEIYLLSVRKLFEERAKEKLKEAKEKGLPIKVKLLKAVKGGYEVEFSDLLKGFLPKSHYPSEITEGEIPVLILKLEENSFVVSHKAFLERERELRWKELEGKIHKEAILQGVIQKVVNGGYLVDFDGVLTGFLPFSEVTRRRVKNLDSLLREGDEIRVKVLEWDPHKKRLRVSAKALEPDPWRYAEKRYHLDQRIRGKITKVENFGAFVEIEPGLEGLIPSSEISWKRGLNPKDILKEEDWVEAVIIDFNPSGRKLVLSLKRMEESPWDRLTKNLKVGDVVSGKIKTITDFGLFIELAEGVEGFIHISKVSWERVTNLKELFKIGEEISAKILEIDFEKKKLFLSLRDLKGDPWKEIATKFKEGDIVEGFIVKELQGKGYLVKIAEGIIGFLPEKELGVIKKDKKCLKEGDSVRGKIILLDPEKKRLWISEKAYLEELERKEVEEYKKKEEEKRISLGELIKQKGLFKEE